MYPFPHYGDFTAFTPVIPELYWNVYSAEERIKALCLEWVKLVAFTDAMVDTVNEQYAEITDDIQARYDALDEAVSNIQDIVNDMQTRLPQLVNDDVVTEIRRLITSGEFDTMLQAAIDEYWTQYGSRLTAAEEAISGEITNRASADNLLNAFDLGIVPKIEDWSEGPILTTHSGYTLNAIAYDDSAGVMYACFNGGNNGCIIDKYASFATLTDGETATPTATLQIGENHANAASIDHNCLYVFDFQATSISVIDLSTFTLLRTINQSVTYRSGAVLPNSLGIAVENYYFNNLHYIYWNEVDSFVNAVSVKIPLASNVEWIQDSKFIGSNYWRLCSAGSNMADTRSYFEIYEYGSSGKPIHIPIFPIGNYEWEGFAKVGNNIYIARQTGAMQKSADILAYVPQQSTSIVASTGYATMNSQFGYSVTSNANNGYAYTYDAENYEWNVVLPEPLRQAISRNSENPLIEVKIPTFKLGSVTTNRYGGVMLVPYRDLSTTIGTNANIVSYFVANEAMFMMFFTFLATDTGFKFRLVGGWLTNAENEKTSYLLENIKPANPIVRLFR